MILPYKDKASQSKFFLDKIIDFSFIIHDIETLFRIIKQEERGKYDRCDCSFYIRYCRGGLRYDAAVCLDKDHGEGDGLHAAKKGDRPCLIKF